ncbi:MAG TPA: NAD(P)-dependent oxidoreductase [Candidatus Limnocylindrales bacterium]|nr:NAD(P)-dependent oxidoreductase [Candidatus Limnocylindrales bacterium]
MYDPSSEYATGVLVLGATGAIGSAVSRDLVLNGYRVYGLIRDEAARARLSYAVVGVIGDLRAPEKWDTAIEGCQIVVNCASPGDLGAGPMTREKAEREAEELAKILDRICDAVRHRKRRMIHTFGALLYEPDANGWVRENAALSSGRGFGIRHRYTYPVFERQRKKGLKAMSVNPAFVYGRRGWFEYGLLRPMLEGQAVILGDGAQTMHYIAASDAASGYRLAIENGLDGDDYLLADDRPSTQGEFTKLVASLLGVPEPKPVPEEELTPVLGEWNVEAYTFCPKVDSTKARERLGWTPRYRTIEEGLPVVIREFKRSRLKVPVG